MHINSKEYEVLVAEIAQPFFEGKDDSAFEVKFGRRNRWRGVSGYEHQIDVSLQSISKVVLIECKCWDRNVAVSQFLTFLGRVQDIKPMHPNAAVEGVMITNVGFQKGVFTLANHYKTVDLQIVYDYGRQFDWSRFVSSFVGRISDGSAS
jgi:hypothetical protein